MHRVQQPMKFGVGALCRSVDFRCRRWRGALVPRATTLGAHTSDQRCREEMEWTFGDAGTERWPPVMQDRCRRKSRIPGCWQWCCGDLLISSVTHGVALPSILQLLMKLTQIPLARVGSWKLINFPWAPMHAYRSYLTPWKWTELLLWRSREAAPQIPNPSEVHQGG
jgi:hypothetical protein